MYNGKLPLRPGPHLRKKPEYKCLLSADSLKAIFAGSADFESREIYFGLGAEVRLQVCWLDGVVSGGDISEQILRPLTELSRARGVAGELQCLELVMGGAVYSYSAKQRLTADQVVDDMTHGHCAVIFQGLHRAVCFEVRSEKARAVSEPTLEKSLKGAKDAFVETLRVNTALVRRRLCTPKLKLMESVVGRKSNTRVALMYLDGVADPGTVEELAARLDALDIDALLATGKLEEYIVDAPRSLFPQLIHTERPDRFAAYLSDGRIGLLADGLPVGLVLPVTFAEFMKVTGDSSNHYIVATVLTVIRYMALVLGLLFPALYVAMAMYHQEMIPARLLLSIIDAKRNVPFSTGVEVLGMLLAFSFLQEAGLRLPNPIGDTVSIIGALIVGQSAVEARVVSPIAIIVVAVSAIACYTLPSQDMGAAVRLISFVFVLAAMASGLFGVGALCCLLLLHLAGIDSFGVNYTAPLSDGRPFPVLRLLIQRPKPLNKFRDPQLKTPDRRRQA